MLTRSATAIGTFTLTVVLLIALVALLRFSSVVPTHIVGFHLDDPSISHEFIPERISGIALLAICTVLPVVGIAVANTPLPPLRDPLPYLVTVIGNLTTLLFTLLAKHASGQLRPNFLALCQPDESLVPDDRAVNASLSSFICLGEDSIDGRHSLPSSHSSQVLFDIYYSLLE